MDSDEAIARALYPHIWQNPHGLPQTFIPWDDIRLPSESAIDAMTEREEADVRSAIQAQRDARRLALVALKALEDLSQ